MTNVVLILSDATGCIMFKRLSTIRLAAKVPLLVATCAAITAIAVGTANYLSTAERIHLDAKSKLEALTENRAHELENYLHSIEKDLVIAANSPSTSQAMVEFTSAWANLENPGEVLKADYITNNPNPTGEKHKLDAAEGFNGYNISHKQYHSYFRSIMEARGYYDIFLIDPDGNLVYSVFKEADFATNLLTGEWSETDLGKAFNGAISAEKDQIRFFDFAPYAPSANAPASFISTPIISDGKVLGVIAFQMPVDALNKLMSETKGLGITGETIIVGSDLKLRNDSSFTEENDILKTSFDSDLAKTAFEEGSGSVFGVTDVYRGVTMDFDITPLNFGGVTWGVVALESLDELEAPLRELRNEVIFIILAALGIMALIGYLAAKTITKPINFLVQEMSDLAGGNLDVKLEGQKRTDEIGEMYSAVAVFRDNAIERLRLEGQSEEERLAESRRQQSIEGLITGFRDNVQVLLSAVSENTQSMEGTAKILTNVAESTADQASSAATASEQASGNVQTVAAAAEELASSVDEITRQVNQTTEIVQNANLAASSSNEKVGALSNAATKIGNVVSLIQDIAEQTNLLALNATIEAARAGEMGKGFAVVASEVKSLANQTAKATEDISQQISSIQTETDAAVVSIKSITDIMEEVNSYTSAIAAAVEEQGAATAEISRNVQQAAMGTSEVAQNISGVRASVGETSQSASEVLSASSDVAERAKNLGIEIDSFLKNVAAA